MTYTTDDFFLLLQQPTQVDDFTRLKIFEFLSEWLSIIPVRGGFPNPGESPKKYKAPVQKKWQKWCNKKRPFVANEFSPDRAGVACGKASGVLVLDIDDMTKFKKWLTNQNVKAELPNTLTVKSGGIGERYHYYFQYPQDGQRYGNRSVKKIFEIKGVGGQVLCPGSIHPETRNPYYILNFTNISEAPEWLLNYSLYMNVHPKPVDHSLPKKQTEIQMMSTVPSLPYDQYVADLPVSDKIKQMIMSSFPKGERSEASMTVLVGLLSANVENKTIVSIYENYPIGEKARELGSKWLEREIENAKNHIALEKTKAPRPDNPFTPSGTQTPSDTYCVFNAMDVVNKDVQFDFFIDDFWPKGEPLLITGPGGAGKSILTLQIAMDLISPPENGFLDTFHVEQSPHKVLFVQSENTFVGMKKRFLEVRSSKSKYQISDQILREGIFFLGINNDIRSIGDMMNQTFLDAIKNAVETHQTDIIILDPLISFHGQDENSNDQMRRLLDRVAIFTESLGASPLLIHHHGKFTSESGPGGGRGASAIGDWSPNTWELTYSKNQKHFSLTHKKARNLALQGTLDLELHYLRFYPIALQSSGSAAMEIVVKALKNLGGVANVKKDFKEEVQKVYNQTHGKTISTNTAGSRIEEAVDANLIKKTPIAGSKGYKYSL